MNRRSFLRMIGIGAAVASIPKIADSNDIVRDYVDDVAVMVGKDGKVYPLELTTNRFGNPICSSNFPKALWPGIKESFEKHYSQPQPNFSNLFRK